jgi:O-antigen/teichoic acid export membrane protein
MAPGVFFTLLVAVICTLIFAVSPAVFQELAQSEPDMAWLANGGGAVTAILVTWVFALIYLIVFAFGVAVATVIGVLILMLWRAIFMRPRPSAPAAAA